jgi:hypothetical protein
MTEIVVIKNITKEMEDQYLEVPFQMPEHVESLHVNYEIIDKGASKSIVDLGIRDAKRVRGWSGGARMSFFISREKATPGYLAGSLEPTEWAILLGTYRIAQAGCEVKVTIRFELQEPRWYKGDLHTHTVHSDGKFELSEVVQIALENQLDFIALTDHNTISQNYVYPKENNLIFIPGMELTTNHGHCNLLGVADPIQDFRSTSNEQVLARIEEAKEKGALVVLNHPHCPHCPWEWSFDVPYDAVEIWNGPWRENNQHSLDWWQSQLAQGKKIVAVGGSDVHAPQPIVRHGYPTTWIYSPGKDSASLLAALRKGHTFITYGPVAPTVQLTCGEKMMGDVVYAIEEPVLIELQQLQAGDLIRIYTNQGKTEEWAVTDEHTVTLLYQLDKETSFIRVEVWRMFPEANKLLPVTISNPVYVKREIES